MFFLAKIEVIGKLNAELTSKPLLIIANHKSYYDPLLIAVSLKLSSKVYPLGFIAKDEFFQNKISRLFFRSIGSFPTHSGGGLDRSLEIPLGILKNKGSVVFFPEAQCVREDFLGNGKIGAATLALKIPEAHILPIAIHNSHKIGRIFKRPLVKVSIGRPFYLKDVVKNIENITPQELTDLFMKKSLGNLYSQFANVESEEQKPAII